MRTFVDRNDDEILGEEIHVSRPRLHARMTTLLTIKGEGLRQELFVSLFTVEGRPLIGNLVQMCN
jgi:hypothetical protein